MLSLINQNTYRKILISLNITFSVKCVAEDFTRVLQLLRTNPLTRQSLRIQRNRDIVVHILFVPRYINFLIS